MARSRRAQALTARTDRRRLIALGAVLVVLVAAFAARAVFGGGGSSSSNNAERTNPFEPVPGVSTTSVPPSPPTFPVYGSKNPFEPVIQVTQTTTTPTTSGGGTTTTTRAGGGGGTTTTTVPSNNPPPSQTVTLIDVFRDNNGVEKATVRVGSTVFTVGEGDTFANGAYRVVSLDDPCGQFLFGDSPFKLCVGEQTLK